MANFQSLPKFFYPHLSQVPKVPKVLPVPPIQNSEFKIQNSEYPTPLPSPKSPTRPTNSKFKIQNSEYPTPPPSPKSPTRPTNSKFKIQNSKFKIILYLCPLKGNTTFFEDEYHNKNKIQLS